MDCGPTVTYYLIALLLKGDPELYKSSSAILVGVLSGYDS